MLQSLASKAENRIPPNLVCLSPPKMLLVTNPQSAHGLAELTPHHPRRPEEEQLYKEDGAKISQKTNVLIPPDCGVTTERWKVFVCKT